jgi:demethylmenaquinone methyltransferase/2-methoxy-6-polyprenyl-1,4-benzoquinol methylase
VELVHRFFSGTGSTYDWMARYAMFGLDGRWKRRIIELLPPDARRILDLACGTGISTMAIARRFPYAHVTGVELREEYLEIARRKVYELGLVNVEFVLSRAEDYRSSEPFDCVASSYLPKYADLKRLIPAAESMLRAGGLLLMHDFSYPTNTLLLSMWRLYFSLLQRVGAPIFPAWREIYHELPRLIQETRWIPDLTEALKDNGFESIQVERLTGGSSTIVAARKPGRDRPADRADWRRYRTGSQVLQDSRPSPRMTHRYEARMVPARAGFASSPAITRLQDPGIDSVLFELFLIHFTAVGVAMTEPVEDWIRRAGERCDRLGMADLGRALRRHSAREAGHHVMLIEDARTLVDQWNSRRPYALDAEDIRGRWMTDGVKRYRGLHEESLAGAAPYVQVAIEYEIERVSVQFGPTFIERCANVLGPSMTAGLRFLRHHVSLDVGHTRFNRRQLDRLLRRRPDSLDALVSAGEAALHAYEMFLRDCLRLAEIERDRLSWNPILTR